MANRSNKGTVRVSRRDIAILLAVADSIMLSTSQLATLFFPSAKKACARLKQLSDTGFLAPTRKQWVFAEARTENFYTLTKKGRGELRRARGEGSVNRFERPRVNVNHLAATNQFGILMEQEAVNWNTGEALLIPFWRLPEATQRNRESSPGKGFGRNLVKSIKPDGLVMLRNTSGTSLLSFLEIDLDSEPISRSKQRGSSSLGDKLKKYCDYFDTEEYRHDCEPIFDASFRGFRVLLVTTSNARLQSLRTAIAHLGDTHFVWGTTFEHLVCEGVLGETWQVLASGASETQQHSLCQGYKHPLEGKPPESET